MLMPRIIFLSQTTYPSLIHFIIPQWYIDSAAIGPWHVGGPPDDRAIKCLKTKGIETDHIVRQVSCFIAF